MQFDEADYYAAGIARWALEKGIGLFQFTDLEGWYFGSAEELDGPTYCDYIAHEDLRQIALERLEGTGFLTVHADPYGPEVIEIDANSVVGLWEQDARNPYNRTFRFGLS